MAYRINPANTTATMIETISTVRNIKETMLLCCEVKSSMTCWLSMELKT